MLLRDVSIHGAEDTDEMPYEAIQEVAEAQPRSPRIVHASTCSLYGPRNPHHQTELLRADTPARPFEHYGRQKQEAAEIAQSSNLAWVVLRLGSVDPAAMPFSASETDEIQRHLG